MSRFFVDPYGSNADEFDPMSFGYNNDELDRLAKLQALMGAPNPVKIVRAKVEGWYQGLNDDQQFAAEMAGVIAASAGAFGALVVNDKIRNYTLRKLWDWHMVPLGLKPITKEEANGISSLIMFASGVLTLTQVKQKEDAQPVATLLEVYKKIGLDTAITLTFLAFGRLEQKRKK